MTLVSQLLLWWWLCVSIIPLTVIDWHPFSFIYVRIDSWILISFNGLWIFLFFILMLTLYLFLSTVLSVGSWLLLKTHHHFSILFFTHHHFLSCLDVLGP
jgi:hypothetical protein